MNTLNVKVPDAMAREVAQATDILGMPSNEAFVFHAVSLVLRSVLGARRGRPYKHQPLPPRKKPAKGRRGGRC